MEQKKFLFDRDEAERLDKYLAYELDGISRSQIQRLIKNGYILLNDIQPEKSGVFLERGDRVLVHLPKPKKINLEPEKIPLDIVYEDSNVIVINKPAGMVVHPSAGHDKGTLVHAVLAHAPYLGAIGGVHRPGIVHRLDKNTSGLVIIAKNECSHYWLQNQFKKRKVEKIYYALVDGHPLTQSGKITADIYRDRSNRKKMAISPQGRGKYAETRFFTERVYRNHTYLQVHPITGRTHQIRVHLSSINLPIVGDTVYGYKSPTILLNRHFLHAALLRICLPGDTEKTEFLAQLPIELTEILNDLS